MRINKFCFDFERSYFDAEHGCVVLTFNVPNQSDARELLKKDGVFKNVTLRIQAKGKNIAVQYAQPDDARFECGDPRVVGITADGWWIDAFAGGTQLRNADEARALEKAAHSAGIDDVHNGIPISTHAELSEEDFNRLLRIVFRNEGLRLPV